MPSIMDMISSQLGSSGIKEISSKLGADEGSTGKAVGAAVPLLLSALSRNASSEDGARSLSKAIDRDHDGSIMDNLSGFLGQGDDSAGQGILKHVLGPRQGQVEAGLGASAGLDKNTTGKLLGMLAPVVLGVLGKKKREEGLGSSDLAGMLGQERQEIERREPKSSSLFGSLLDQDGDGDTDLGDLASGLGKLFG